MTKKIISLILLLCFCLTLFPSLIFSVEASEISVEREAKLLSSIGLIDNSYASSLNPGKPIKRGEFASLICTYTNIGTFRDDVCPFSDVTAEHKYYSSILAVNKYNLMSGSGDGSFNPDINMSYVQVYKVILNLLGYNDLAKVYGGYPIGYVTLASKTGVSRYVNVSDYNTDAKSGDVIKILVNALDVKLAEHKGIKGDDLILSTDADKTLLNIYHNIEVGEGTIKATSRYQAADIDPLLNNEILIDDTLYKTDGNKNYDSYFGYNIRFYYSTSKKKHYSYRRLL